MPWRSSFARMIASLAVAGCSSTNPAPDVGMDSGIAASDAGSGVDARRAPGCPDTPPEAGASCASMWPCGYGSDPRCMTVATCASPDGIHNLAWYVEAPDPSCNGNPVECPAAFDAGAGGACPVQGTCTYPEGRCACGLCNMGGVCTDMCGPDIDAGPSIDGGLRADGAVGEGLGMRDVASGGAGVSGSSSVPRHAVLRRRPDVRPVPLLLRSGRRWSRDAVHGWLLGFHQRRLLSGPPLARPAA